MRCFRIRLRGFRIIVTFTIATTTTAWGCSLELVQQITDGPQVLQFVFNVDLHGVRQVWLVQLARNSARHLRCTLDQAVKEALIALDGPRCNLRASIDQRVNRIIVVGTSGILRGFIFQVLLEVVQFFFAFVKLFLKLLSRLLVVDVIPMGPDCPKEGRQSDGCV